MHQVTLTLVMCLERGIIKENIVPLLNMIFDTDKTLTQVNAELDLKTFLFERYQHRIQAFDPFKEHLLEIDMKEFSINFSKYGNNSPIYDVSKRLLSKKKNKNRYFYYDCRKECNAFDYSLIGECPFINYELKSYQKRIIRSMLNMLMSGEIKKENDEIVVQLHKLLLNYRILLPFALSEMVNGMTLVEWLINEPSLSRKKYKLLVFLSLNCNLLIKDKTGGLYNFRSLSDYVCCKVALILFNQKEERLSSLLAGVYMLQVTKFSTVCNAHFSKEK